MLLITWKKNLLFLRIIFQTKKHKNANKKKINKKKLILLKKKKKPMPGSDPSSLVFCRYHLFSIFEKYFIEKI